VSTTNYNLVPLLFIFCIILSISIVCYVDNVQAGEDTGENIKLTIDKHGNIVLSPKPPKTISIYQQGAFNIAYQPFADFSAISNILQLGERNFSAIVQKSENNQAQITQKGDNNRAVIKQNSEDKSNKEED